MQMQGTYTAMITPFKNGAVDYDGFRANIHFQISQGINGILPIGTSGESPTLTRDEQTSLICVAVEEAKGKIPIMVGTGSNSTEHTIENTRIAKELGADIALVVTPYYNKPTNEGVYRHFKAVAEAVDIPIVVYNIQGRTGKNIDTTTLKRIADLPNIIGVKEASGNVDQVGEVINSIARTKPNFSVMSGDDSLTIPIIALGGKGIISVVSNLIPRKVVDMVNFALSGDFHNAREVHHYLLPLFKVVFIETSPIPIKAAMNMCNMPAGDYRLPLCELLPEDKEKLRKVLADMKLIPG